MSVGRRHAVRDLGTHNRLLQRLQHIFPQVVHVLDAAAQPDQIVEHARRFPLVLGNACMRHGGRHFAQRFDAAERLGEHEDLGVLTEALGDRGAAFEPEGEHTAAHTVAVLFDGDGALRVGLQAGVVDRNDVGRGFQSGRDGHGVLGGSSGAKVKGLEAAVGEPAVEGAGNGTDCVLEEGESFFELGRVEGCDAHEDIRMSVDVFRNGVNDNIGAVIKWILDIRGEECVVDYDKDAMSMCD